MKKMKGLVLGLLAFGCLTASACGGVGTKNSTYTVTLMDGSTVLSTVEKDKATHLDAPAAPTKEGYTFKGWFIDEACTIPYTPDLLSANLTLYAKFEANTLYITLNLNGGTLSENINKVEVKSGEAYTIPTPAKEGYTFLGWTVDGEDFPASGTYNKNNSIRVTANWTLNKYTVTFSDGTQTLATVENVEHGAKVQAWNNPAPGYEVVGIYTDAEMTTVYDFDTPVTSALTLYVKTQPKTFNILVNQDGDVSLDTTAVYGGAYTLAAAPTREGYFFRGYTMNDQPFAATGTYTWATDIVVVVTWEKDPAFGKSTVSFYDGTTEIEALRKVVEDGSQLTALVDAPAKAGYTFNGWYTDSALTTAFVSGMVVNDDMSLYAKYTPNTYTLSVNLDGGTINDQAQYSVSVIYGTTYSIPTPVKNGYKFEGFKYGNNAFAASGAYTYTDSISVTAVWTKLEADADEASDELFMNKGSYFKEREETSEEFTYVFVTGGEYTFSTLESLVIEGAASGALTQNGKAFTANSVEDSFTLVFTKKIDGVSITYRRNAKIVDQVTSFAHGNDYSSIWGAGAANREGSFMNVKEDAIMSVGASNYVPDLAVGTHNSTALNKKTAYLSVTATIDGVETQDFTYENGVINFNSTLVGKKVVLTFKAKYDLDATAVTMTVNVNNGVNVYNNEELKAAYGNRSVSLINVLRNIKAEIGANDYVAGTQYPINQYEYGVYVREVASTNDQITVNGNFFSIDGSDLPLGNNDVDGREWSVAGEAGFYVNNMQVGLFLYYNHSDNVYYHNGQVTFNDLHLTGNYNGDADKQVDYKGKKLLVNSGSYHGIVLRGGRATVENTTIVNTNIALFSDGGISGTDGTQQASQWIVNSARLDHSWSNQMYMYDFAKATFTNSYLGDCGGAAIHLDDIAYSETALNSVLNVDAATTFDTWIGGDETYFTSRGFGPLALQVKGGVNQGLADATFGYKQMGMPLPDTKITKTVNSVECMNLVLLVRGVGSENSDWAADQNGIPSIQTNLPIYADLMKANVQDPTAFDLANVPGQGKPVYMGFNTRLVDPSVAAADYMLGYVEVMKA